MARLQKTYRRPGAELRLGDCLAVLPGLAAESFDAMITDPPYCSGAVSEAARTHARGQGLRSETIRLLGWFVGDNMGTAGLAFLLRAVAWQAGRLLKPTGSLLVFVDWRQIPNLAPAIESAGLRWQNLLTWDKKSPGLGRGFRHRQEHILHFTNGAPEYFDRSTPNVLPCPRLRAADRRHQTQKPLDLLARLVRVVAPPDGLVLDPFAGSASTLLAALQEGRRAVGIESDPAAFKTARQRLADFHACQTDTRAPG